MSVKVGLLATLAAKPEKAAEVADFLTKARALAVAEQGTVTWYAFKLDDVTFGIFDTFEGDEGRQAHLGGEIASALMANAPDLLAADPEIKSIDILAAK